MRSSHNTLRNRVLLTAGTVAGLAALVMGRDTQNACASLIAPNKVNAAVAAKTIGGVVVAETCPPSVRGLQFTESATATGGRRVVVLKGATEVGGTRLGGPGDTGFSALTADVVPEGTSLTARVEDPNSPNSNPVIIGQDTLVFSCQPTETTVAPTTVAPTTVAPTTVAPTTVAPTTVAPTTTVTTLRQGSTVPGGGEPGGGSLSSTSSSIYEVGADTTTIPGASITFVPGSETGNTFTVTPSVVDRLPLSRTC